MGNSVTISNQITMDKKYSNYKEALMPDVLPEAPPVHPWLAPFRPPDRLMVRAWFNCAVSQGARRPEAVVEMVSRLVGDKLSWSVSATSLTLCETTLAALAHRRGEALAYAAALLSALETP